MAIDPRWRPSGYPAAPVFRAAAFCRFHLSHVRRDGLAVVTLGHHVGRGGRLEPMGQGLNYMTWVASVEWPPEDAEGAPKRPKVAFYDRAGANDWRVAESQHMAMLDVWADKAPGEPIAALDEAFS